MLSRRTLLRAAGALTAVAGGGALLTVGRWWDRGAGEGYLHLSPDEAAIVRAVAGAAWPAGEIVTLDGETADLDHFFDEMIHTMPEMPQKLLRALLHILDDLSRVTAGGGLVALTREARTKLIMGWMEDDLHELRSAVTGLVVLLGMGFTTHPKADGPLHHLYRCGYYR